MVGNYGLLLTGRKLESNPSIMRSYYDILSIEVGLFPDSSDSDDDDDSSGGDD